MKRSLLDDMQIMEPVGEKSFATRHYEVRKYAVRGKCLKPLQVGNFMNAYSVQLENGLCFPTALMLLTREPNLREFDLILKGQADSEGIVTPEECMAQAQAAAKQSPSGCLGHDLNYIEAVCDRLGIAEIGWNGFIEYCNLGQKIHLKENVQRGCNVPSLPAILHISGTESEPGHVVLLTAQAVNKQIFTCKHILKALAPSMDDPRLVNIPDLRNNHKVQQKKACNKALKKMD